MQPSFVVLFCLLCLDLSSLVGARFSLQMSWRSPCLPRRGRTPDDTVTSNLTAMASTLVAMASNLPAIVTYVHSDDLPCCNANSRWALSCTHGFHTCMILSCFLSNLHGVWREHLSCWRLCGKTTKPLLPSASWGRQTNRLGGEVSRHHRIIIIQSLTCTVCGLYGSEARYSVFVPHREPHYW